MKKIFKPIMALVLTGIISLSCTCGAHIIPNTDCTCGHQMDDILPEKTDL